MAGVIGGTAASASQIDVTHAWSRATPGGSPVAAGYLTIENHDNLPDRLLAVRSTFAKKIELHTTLIDHGITSMHPAEGGLLIPAAASITLQPGGSHLMFVGLNEPFIEGQKVTVELIFERAGKVVADLDVAAVGSSKPSPKLSEVVPAPSPEETFFTHLCGEKLMANVTVSPARPGDFEVLVELEDVEEQPLAAQAVAVTLFDEKRQAELITAEAERVGAEKWRVKMSVPTRGTWVLSLDVQTTSIDRVKIAAPILIY
jgi:copper(I)-binding protein